MTDSRVWDYTVILKREGKEPKEFVVPGIEQAQYLARYFETWPGVTADYHRRGTP